MRIFVLDKKSYISYQKYFSQSFCRRWFALDDLTGALELFEQAHNMYGRILGQDTNHRDIAKCKYLIGLTHLAIGDQDKAAEALDHALRMWTNVLPQ